MTEITDAARRIGAKDLSQRIPVRNKKDELGRLAATFNEMLERIEKSFAQIRQFSADASHELRTPLTILKGETEWALRTARNAEDYKEILTSSLEEINNMSRIVEDLLILSRADIGETPMEMEPVELSTIITEVYEMGTTLAESRKQKLELNVGELNGIKIMGNELRLRRLFLNLIDNGVKYTKNGGHIHIDASVRSDSVEVRVTDNGMGIAPEDQDKDLRPLLSGGQEPLAKGGRDRAWDLRSAGSSRRPITARSPFPVPPAWGAPLRWCCRES